MDDLVERITAIATPAARGRPLHVVDLRGNRTMIHVHMAKAMRGEIVLAITDESRGVTVERLRMRSEGNQGPRRLLADLSCIAPLVERAVDLTDREAIVAGAGTLEAPYPAWAFVMHPVALRLVDLAGADRALIARPATWRLTERGMSHGDAAWNAARERTCVRMFAPAPFGHGGIGSMELTANGSLISASLLSMRVGGTFFVLNEKSGRTTLTIDAVLPETLMQSVAGHPLRAVVDADWGCAGDLAIRACRPVDHRPSGSAEPLWRTCLTLERAVAPLQDGPHRDIIERAA